jgi:hypothetical protein
MFSKLILHKLASFEVQVTNNLCWQAPILLYPESKTGKTKIKKVKAKHCRNPIITSSPIYEKSYMQWTGQRVEGCYKSRAMINEYIKQNPLNNVNEQANVLSLLLSWIP